MKTDSFFYRFFAEFPGAFFALIGDDEGKAESYSFTSVEVKEQAFRFDGIFVPDADDDEIYFVEVQFSKDADFYSRFFSEIFLYLRQYHPTNDWRAVVLFPQHAFDPGRHLHYREFFDSGRLRWIYLNQLPKVNLSNFPLSILQIISQPAHEIVSTVTTITKQLTEKMFDEKEQEKIVELLINLLMNKLPQLSRKEIEKMIEPMLSDIKKSRAYQEIAQEAKQEGWQQGLQQGLQEGLQEGWQAGQKEGRQAGRQEQVRQIAKAMLKKNLSHELIAEITRLSQQDLLELSKELADNQNQMI